MSFGHISSLKYVSYFPQKIAFDVYCCSLQRQFARNVKSLLSRKNEKNITNLSSAEFPQRVAKVRQG